MSEEEQSPATTTMETVQTEVICHQEENSSLLVTAEMLEQQEVITTETSEAVEEVECDGSECSLCDDGDVPVRTFLVPTIDMQLERVVKKKWSEAMALRRFSIEKEIEWLEKFIAFLKLKDCGVEDVKWTLAERQKALESAEERLQTLLVVHEPEGVAKVLEDLLHRIADSSACTDLFRYRSDTWNEAVFESLELQKLLRCCEKISWTEYSLGAEFWFFEIKTLLLAMDEESRTIGIGLLIELACRKTAPLAFSSKFSTNYEELLFSILIHEHLREHVFLEFERMFLSFQGQMTLRLMALRLFATVFLEIKTNDAVFWQRVGRTLCEQLTCVLEHEDLIADHWSSVIEVIEIIGSRLELVWTEKFGRVFTMLETKSYFLSESLRTKILSTLTLSTVTHTCVSSVFTGSSFPPISKTSSTVLEESWELRKILMICETIGYIEERFEAEFWFYEISALLETMDVEKRTVGIGMIIELAVWKSAFYEHLLWTLLINEQLKVLILIHFEQILTTRRWAWGVDVRLKFVKLFAEVFLKIDTADVVIREKYGRLLCEQLIIVMEHRELISYHWSLIIEIIESVRVQLESQFNEMFLRICVLLEIKSTTSVSESLRVLFGSVLRVQSTVTFTEEERIEWMKTTEEEIRIRIEEEFQVKQEAIRVDLEVKKTVEVEESTKRIEKEWEQKLKTSETEIRRTVEEEIKKREEEGKRKAAEEEKKRKEEEEERKRKAAEEERKRQAQEAEKKRVAEYKKAHPCTFLPGYTFYLHTQPQKTYSQGMLDGKVIGLLFSGYWCGPCQQFVPKLKTFYDQVEDDFEVVFISSDRSENDMNYFLQQMHGNWFNLKFGSCEANNIKVNWRVNSIPKLVIMNPNGQIISNNGTTEVMNCQNAAALVSQWKRSI